MWMDNGGIVLLINFLLMCQYEYCVVSLGGKVLRSMVRAFVSSYRSVCLEFVSIINGT